LSAPNPAARATEHLDFSLKNKIGSTTGLDKARKNCRAAGARVFSVLARTEATHAPKNICFEFVIQAARQPGHRLEKLFRQVTFRLAGALSNFYRSP
jgi:hypothetical protein